MQDTEHGRSTLPARIQTTPAIMEGRAPAERPHDAALRRPLGEQVAAALQAAGRSHHTRRSYETAIGLFLQYLEGALGDRVPDRWRPLASCDSVERPTRSARTVKASEWAYGGPAGVLQLVMPGHLDGYRAWREAQGDSPNTASTRVYAVRTFLSVAYRDEVLHGETAQRLGLRAYRARQRRDRTEKGRRLTPKEAQALRASVDPSGPKGIRDRAILDLMLYLGLRCAEVAGLRLSDFRQDGGRWWLVVTGKGSKTRRLKLHDVAYRSVRAWLALCGATFGQDRPVFVGVNKAGALGTTPVNTSTVARLVSEYGAVAGLAAETRLAPHDLRRTCARTAYDNGAPLPKIQAMLGHASPDTTAGYIGADRDDTDTGVDYVRY
jgi:integrase/recombinase XerD